MAGTGTYTARNIDQSDAYEYPFVKELLNDPSVHSNNVYVLEKYIRQPSPATIVELRESYTDLLAGTTTAVKLDVVSSDAKDDASAGDGCRTIALVGFSSADATPANAIPYVETIEMAGATPVTTSRYYVRNPNIVGLTFGSENDPAGTITVSEVGGAVKCYATLAAGSIGSVNARTYILNGWYAKVVEFKGQFIQTADASTGQAADGANVYPLNENITVVAGNGNIANIMGPGQFDLKNLFDGKITGSDTKYISWAHQSVDTDLTDDPIQYKIAIILWKLV